MKSAVVMPRRGGHECARDSTQRRQDAEAQRSSEINTPEPQASADPSHLGIAVFSLRLCISASLRFT